MTNYLRPDELARESEIKKAQGRTNELRSGIETISSLGTVGIGAKAASKILPFLSQHIPEDLAFKGINKVIPALGDFLKNGMKQGLSLKSGLDFIKKEFSDQESKQETTKQNRNIIEQESPELHQFLDQLIRGGRKPIEAAALAQNDKRFASVIQKLSKTHKVPWSQIIQSIYGLGETAQPNQQQQTQQQQQTGQGQAALMQILQKINQRVG